MDDYDKEEAKKKKDKKDASRRNMKTFKNLAEVDKFDPETEEEVKLTSKSALQKFPPPKKNSIFVSRWEQYIEDVVNRGNFKQGHLYQLEILCDLFYQLAKLNKIIRVKGYTYKAIGRNGVQLKVRPEVQIQQRVLSEIRNYSKTLGLLLMKDAKMTKKKSDSWG